MMTNDKKSRTALGSLLKIRKMKEFEKISYPIEGIIVHKLKQNKSFSLPVLSPEYSKHYEYCHQH